jgi:hypothetical protein
VSNRRRGPEGESGQDEAKAVAYVYLPGRPAGQRCIDTREATLPDADCRPLSDFGALELRKSQLILDGGLATSIDR